MIYRWFIHHPNHWPFLRTSIVPFAASARLLARSKVKAEMSSLSTQRNCIGLPVFSFAICHSAAISVLSFRTLAAVLLQRIAKLSPSRHPATKRSCQRCHRDRGIPRPGHRMTSRRATWLATWLATAPQRCLPVMPLGACRVENSARPFASLTNRFQILTVARARQVVLCGQRGFCFLRR